MRAISKRAARVMDILTEGLEKPEDHKKIANSDAYMAVCVECIGEVPGGKLYSVAHYYKQNGDAMRDPEMVFLKLCPSEKLQLESAYYPVSYQQDSLALYQEAVEFDECGNPRSFRPRLMKDLCAFTTDWMRNIKEQQL